MSTWGYGSKARTFRRATKRRKSDPDRCEARRRRPRKEAYLAALPSKPAASLLVSLADKTHNASAIPGDYRELGDELWDRFNGGREGTIWYYRSLSDVFGRVVPGALAEQLSRTVIQFASRA